MPDQPELRQRLSDFIREHEGPFANKDQTASECACGWEGNDPNDPWLGHVVGALLALPGIAIVDTAIEHPLNDRWKALCRTNPEGARSLAYGLLAGAAAVDAAEAQTNA